MNPEHTIRTDYDGRRAAAIRDGRAGAGDATTKVIAKHAPAPWDVHCEAGHWWITDAEGEEIAGDLRREDAHLMGTAPRLLAVVHALLAVAPANVMEDAQLLGAVMAGNQAVRDALGRRRCDWCNSTGFMRLLSTHTYAPCNRCERQ
jgi:hypothetical protein